VKFRYVVFIAIGILVAIYGQRAFTNYTWCKQWASPYESRVQYSINPLWVEQNKYGNAYTDGLMKYPLIAETCWIKETGNWVHLNVGLIPQSLYWDKLKGDTTEIAPNISFEFKLGESYYSFVMTYRNAAMWGTAIIITSVLTFRKKRTN
jgi:hypothetical protein